MSASKQPYRCDPGTVDERKPATWVRFRPALCRGCWATCCTLPLTVTSEDLFHMGFLEMHEVNGPLKRIAQRLMKAGIVKSYRDRTRTFVVQTKHGNDCRFLDEDRRCTIYERRPSVCRRFPENSARPSYCPRQKKTRVPV